MERKEQSTIDACNMVMSLQGHVEEVEGAHEDVTGTPDSTVQRGDACEATLSPFSEEICSALYSQSNLISQ
jgi:hypothetical protein